MKRILLILSMLYFWLSYGQEKIVFKPLRYDDNFTYLRTDTIKNAYTKLKFIPLNNAGTTYLSFGGDIRFQYFITKNEDWGDTEDDDNGYFLSRYLIHIDFHANRFFRFFYQLQCSNAINRINPSPVEDNSWNTHQLFFDINIPLKSNSNLVFRAGRQEFSYGSQRLVAVRENPNNRLAFDGAKLMLFKRNFRSELFYAQPIVNEKGMFNNHYNENNKLWGNYNVLNNVPLLENIDFYYLGFWKSQVVYDGSTTKEQELRHSMGTRIWNNKGNWYYDFEGLYQFGKIGNQNITAWTLSAYNSYVLNTIKFNPTISLKMDVISGNLLYNDESIETFNPLFPKGGYFGWAGFIGPSNLIDIHPAVDFEISPKINIAIDYDIFWRYSINDGLYAPNFQLIYSGQNSNAKFIGTQLSNQVIYELSRFFLFRLETVWFNAGQFIKDSGAGKDIFSGVITAQFRF